MPKNLILPLIFLLMTLATVAFPPAQQLMMPALQMVGVAACCALVRRASRARGGCMKNLPRFRIAPSPKMGVLQRKAARLLPLRAFDSEVLRPATSHADTPKRRSSARSLPLKSKKNPDHLLNAIRILIPFAKSYSLVKFILGLVLPIFGLELGLVIDLLSRILSGVPWI